MTSGSPPTVRGPRTSGGTARSWSGGGSVGEPVEDCRLAQWVQAVVRRWRARCVAGRELATLYAGLLHELVVARTHGAVTEQLVSVEPDTVADQFAATRTLPWTATCRRRR